MAEKTLVPFITTTELVSKQHKEIAFIYPGQGFQFVKMGEEVFAYSSRARKTYEIANQAVAEFGFEVSTISFKGPKEKLDETWYTQPAILTYSRAYTEAILEECGPDFKPGMVGGFSLGEYSAIDTAGVAPFPDMIKASYLRGKSMKQVDIIRPGGKIIVFNRSEENQKIYAFVCRTLQKDSNLALGAAITPSKLCFGGSNEDIENAIKQLEEIKEKTGFKTLGWSRIAILPYHTEDMRPAVHGLEEALNQISFLPPSIPVVTNNREIITSADPIKGELVAHLTSPVRWISEVNILRKQGIRYLVEPGKKIAILQVSQFAKEDRVILPIRGNNGSGPVLGHISLPKEEAYAA